MAEKIHPSSKQFPNLNNTTRPVYRPQALRTRRTRRSCCCRFCFWTTVTILLLLILAAAAGGVFYLIYRPHRPSFTVSSLQLSQFNLTSSNHLTTRFNFTVTARNPNTKISFHFDPVSVSIHSNGVDVGDGTIPAFVMPKKNTTRLRTVVATNGKSVDGETGTGLRSDLKSKRSLPVRIKLDTKVKVKIGSVKTKKVAIRVDCDGIRVTPPAGKSATTASTADVKCEVDLRIKIWKWTV